MIICITAEGKEESAAIDSRFGRCGFFHFFNTDSGERKTVENPGKNEGGGAGVRAGQLVLDHKAEQVYTGNVGPKAEQVLKEGGVQIHTNSSGSVAELIASFKDS